MNKLATYLSLPLLVVTLVGCGDNVQLDGANEVTEVDVLANDISVGEQVRTDVFFSSERDFNGSAESVEVVLRLSPSLRYVEGSSRIYEGDLNETDFIEVDDVVQCPGGESYVVYRFNRTDLKHNNVRGSNNFALQVQIAGRNADPRAEIQAAAGEVQEFSCDTEFPHEENVFLAVRP